MDKLSGLPFTTTLPTLAKGELNGGLVKENGAWHWVIKLPGESAKRLDFDGSLAYGKSRGGDAPSPAEQAVLRVNLPDEFKPEAYWSNKPFASDESCAWFQYFSLGRQNVSLKSNKLHAVAVRRIPLGYSAMTNPNNAAEREELIARLDALFKTAPELPYYVASDDAGDVITHKKSGLALVDTGRYEDWPIARLCEWSSANLIAGLANAWPEIREALSRSHEDGRRAGLEEKYYELLLQVGNKYPGESRHETALRYLRQAETSVGDECSVGSALKTPKGGA